MPRRHPPRRTASPTADAARQDLRIIGGEWRSRKLPFPAIEGLRPTPDRVRETVFNWLQFHVGGANCLDLFAGSGALGLEALSRGAAHTTFVDQAAAATSQLKRNLTTLKCQKAEVIQMDAALFADQLLGKEGVQYDLVFLDPPFNKGLVEPICKALEASGQLSDHALIYIETESTAGHLDLPEHWSALKEKRAGQVLYRIYERELREL